MMYELSLLSIVPVDYFGGSHNPVIQIPMDGTTTYSQLVTELKTLCNTDHIDDLDEEKYQEAVDDFKNDILFHLQSSIPSRDLDDIVDESLPVYTEESTDDDFEYGYYAFVELITVKGED